eukprot:scaffold284710_cov36-Attheya_sp.AAC.1
MLGAFVLRGSGSLFCRHVVLVVVVLGYSSALSYGWCTSSSVGSYSVGWDSVFWTGMVAVEMASLRLVFCPLLALAAVSKVFWIDALLKVLDRDSSANTGSIGCL